MLWNALLVAVPQIKHPPPEPSAPGTAALEGADTAEGQAALDALAATEPAGEGGA